jgi:hypothetical protein
MDNLTSAMTACAARGPEFVPFRMTCNSGETITSSGNETLVFWTLLSDLTGQARLNSFLDRFESNGSKAKCAIGLAAIFVATEAVFPPRSPGPYPHSPRPPLPAARFCTSSRASQPSTPSTRTG